MNRVIVRRAAAGLAAYLLERVPARHRAGVVIGFDARHKSDVFAEDTAPGVAGAGIRVAAARPRVADAGARVGRCTDLGCAAGVMVTASHNPPADNGYKVYLGDGRQIVPPADAEISAAIERCRPARRRAAGRRSTIRSDRCTSDDDVLERYLRAEVPACAPGPTVAGVPVVYTADARGRGAT